MVNAKGTVPSARWGHKILIFNNILYAFGGRDNVANPNEMYEFHFGMSILSFPSPSLPLFLTLFLPPQSHSGMEEVTYERH